MAVVGLSVLAHVPTPLADYSSSRRMGRGGIDSILPRRRSPHSSILSVHPHAHRKVCSFLMVVGSPSRLESCLLSRRDTQAVGLVFIFMVVVYGSFPFMQGVQYSSCTDRETVISSQRGLCKSSPATSSV